MLNFLNALWWIICFELLYYLFFSPETKYQVNDKTDKRNGGDYHPENFFP
jgi:hypothetical protein